MYTYTYIHYCDCTHYSDYIRYGDYTLLTACDYSDYNLV